MPSNALLGQDLTDRLAAYVESVSFEAGTCIFREGSPPDC